MPGRLARALLGVVASALGSALVAVLLALMLVRAAPGVALWADDAVNVPDLAPDGLWSRETPLVVQYLSWLGGATHGDLGRSLRGGQEVRGMLYEAAWPSLALTALSVGAALLACLGLTRWRQEGRPKS